MAGHTCFQLVFSFTDFSRGVVLGFFHTRSHHPVQWRQTNMVPFCWKLLNKFSKKILALNGDVSTSSQKRPCSKTIATRNLDKKQKKKWVFSACVRDWNWDNPSCIHHLWIGIIRCSMIFLYPLVESGCTTDRFRSHGRSQDFFAAARHVSNYMAQNTTEKSTLMTYSQKHGKQNRFPASMMIVQQL